MFIRVRGIYATALTNLFLSNGFNITQPGEIVAKRFSLKRETIPADVTVKDREDKKGIVIIGDKETVKKLASIFKKAFTCSIFKEYSYGIYDCFKGKILRKERGLWIVEIPGGYGFLEYNGKLREGDIVFVHVKKPFLSEPPLLRYGIAVSGKYARLIQYGRVTFSRHIKNKNRRKELMTLSAFLKLENWGIRWRSNANFGKFEDIIAELESLKRKALKIAKLEDEPPCFVSKGDAIFEIIFSLEDKLKLDGIRNEIVSTLKGHHYFKSLQDISSDVFDWLEYVLDCCDKSRVESRAWNRLHSAVENKIILEHERVNGNIIRIHGEIVLKNDQYLKIRREVRSNGLYDGLGIEKRKGDIIFSYIKVGSIFLPHVYYSCRGDLKGMYVNVNLPIERKSSGIYWYVDLGIDVVAEASGKAKIIDQKELEEMLNRKMITSDFYKLIMSKINYIKSRIDDEKSWANIENLITCILNE